MSGSLCCLQLSFVVFPIASFFRCLQQQRLAAKRGRISPPPAPQGFACLLLAGSVFAEQAEVACATQNLAALADDARAVLAGVELGGAGGVVAHG